MENFVTVPQVTKPEEIEEKLIEIWEELAKENRTRACFFNLIIFIRSSSRSESIRKIANKVMEKFPCRLIFISEDVDSIPAYLSTEVSVNMPHGGASMIACDQIDIKVSSHEIQRVPYLLIPHIIPDLPVTLLWVEDPCIPHPLLPPLIQLSQRVIFDSQVSLSLQQFTITMNQLQRMNRAAFGDLNWARTEGWRDLLISIFDSQTRIEELKNLSNITITYEGRAAESFCHSKIQSLFLLSWLTSRLEWKMKEVKTKNEFHFERDASQIEAKIIASKWDAIGAGTILSVTLQTKEGKTFECSRIKDRHHYVSIQISSAEKCDLPYQFLLGQTATGQSLVKEVCTKGTSKQYLSMLTHLEQVC